MDAIVLRQFCDADIPMFKRWLYLPHVAVWYTEPLDWIEEVEKRNNEFSFIHHFIAEADGSPIGFCQYYEYLHGGEDWHGDIETEGTYSIDYLIGNTEYLGKGFGKAMIGELVAKIKAQDNARRIIVQPEPENKASCNTLLSSGFCYDKLNEVYIMEYGNR